MYQIDQSHEYNYQAFEQILQHSQEDTLENMLEFLQQDQPSIIQQQDQPSIIQQQAHQIPSTQGQQAQNQSQQHQQMYALQQQHIPQASNSRNQCVIYHYHHYPQQQQQPQILNQLPRIQNLIKQNDYQASGFLNQQVYPQQQQQQQNLFQTPVIKQQLNEETRQLKVFKRNIEDADENESVKRTKFEIGSSSNTRLELLNEQITITIFSDSSKLKETNGTPALDKLNSKIREKKGKKNSKNDYDELFYCIENYWIELKNQKKNKMVPANVNFNMSPQI